MRVAVVCFTENGCVITKKLTEGLAARGIEARGYVKRQRTGGGEVHVRPEEVQALRESIGARPEKIPAIREPLGARPEDIPAVREPLGVWTGRHFKEDDGLIFVGAVGIAVRACAPFLEGKAEDPAVVVVDELGKYSISLLSGHVGGANDLARMAADVLGAEPVITTATDLNETFAVDLFAKKNGLLITDLEAARLISAAALAGEPIGFFCDFPTEGTIPKELAPGAEKRCNIRVTVRTAEMSAPEEASEKPVSEKAAEMVAAPEEAAEKTAAPENTRDRVELRLVPRAVVLGIGCRKKTSQEAIGNLAVSLLEEHRIDPSALLSVASIDLKAEEEGLLRFCKTAGVPLTTFSAGELLRAEGTFTESEFVRRTTGVGNVCERSAVCGCGAAGGRLMAEKTASEGVTAAAACRNTVIYF